MKALVVYYTRTGNTRKAADVIAAACGGDLEEVREAGTNRKGIIGWLCAGRDAMKGKTSVIEPTTKRSGDYDVVFIGTPVWAGTFAPALRGYLASANLGSKPIALFCTMGGTNEGGIFASMRELVAPAKVLGELAVRQQEIKDPAALKTRVAAWVAEIVDSAGA